MSNVKGKKREIEITDDNDEDTSEQMFVDLVRARDVAGDVLSAKSPEVVRALFLVMPGGDDHEEFEDFLDDLKRAKDMAKDLYGAEYTPLSAVAVYEDVFLDLDEED